MLHNECQGDGVEQTIQRIRVPLAFSNLSWLIKHRRQRQLTLPLRGRARRDKALVSASAWLSIILWTKIDLEDFYSIPLWTQEHYCNLKFLIVLISRAERYVGFCFVINHMQQFFLQLFNVELKWSEYSRLAHRFDTTNHYTITNIHKLLYITQRNEI